MLHKMFALVAGAALAAGLVTALAAEPETEVADAAIAYIRTLQNPDGGFPAFGEESAPGSTIDAIFALVAAGVDPLSVTNNGNSPADYLETQADTYTVDAGGAAKLALSVVAMALDPAKFGGLDLPSVLEGHYDPSTGVYGLDLFDHAFYILALASGGGEADPTAAAQYLRSVQQTDGGWEFSPGAGSDTNTTAMALQALLAWGTGTNEPITEAALEYLRGVQNPDGGFGFQVGAEPDPNSTALVIQALVAANEDIDEGGPWVPGGNTPMEALLAFQNPETGAFQYAGEDSPFATYQAVPALMLAPFPSLETRPDGFPPVPIPSAIPDVLPPTLVPTATPVADGLPPSGAGPEETEGPWWVIGALVAAGAGVAAAGALVRRRR